MDEATLAKVREAIQSGLNQGKSLDEIKAFMKENGYAEEEINEAFAIVPQTAQPVSEAIPQVSEAPKQGSSKKKIILVIVVAIVLLNVISFSVWYSESPSTSLTPDSEEPPFTTPSETGGEGPCSNSVYSTRENPFSGLIELHPTSTDKLRDAIESRGGSELGSISDLTCLETLSLPHTNISDLSLLAPLSNLNELDIDHTGIIDISPLSSLTKLEVLDIAGTEVSDVSHLAALTNLRKLELRSVNAISDISSLSGLTKLTELGLQNTQVSSTSPLTSLVNLEKLDLSHTLVALEDCESLKNTLSSAEIVCFGLSTREEQYRNPPGGRGNLKVTLIEKSSGESVTEPSISVSEYRGPGDLLGISSSGPHHGGSFTFELAAGKQYVIDVRGVGYEEYDGEAEGDIFTITKDETLEKTIYVELEESEDTAPPDVSYSWQKFTPKSSSPASCYEFCEAEIECYALGGHVRYCRRTDTTFGYPDTPFYFDSCSGGTVNEKDFDSFYCCCPE